MTCKNENGRLCHLRRSNLNKYLLNWQCVWCVSNPISSTKSHLLFSSLLGNISLFLTISNTHLFNSFHFSFFLLHFFFFFENLISNTLYSILLPLCDALAEILHLRRGKKKKNLCSSSMLKIWIISCLMGKKKMNYFFGGFVMGSEILGIVVCRKLMSICHVYFLI